jgi:hypothetical protein
MDPSVLTVYQSPFQKIRIGKEYDGGYVIAVIPDVKYSLLLAGGVADDISFEEDFINKYGATCIAFDGSINRLPKNNTSVVFLNKNIGFNNTNTETNLHDFINCNNNIFIKMDIEGGEIPWIKSLSDKQMNKFEQIVMEFHLPYSDKEIDVFDKINTNHILIHLHVNNCCGFRNHRGVSMPNVFECTYVHKKYFTQPIKLNTSPIPDPIDMRNIEGAPECCINWPPFVN